MLHLPQLKEFDCHINDTLVHDLIPEIVGVDIIMMCSVLAYLGLLLAMCFLVSSDNSYEFRTHFQEGLRHYRQNDHILTEKHMMIALEYEPLNIYANGILGAVCTLQGRLEEGLRFLSVSATNGGLLDASITASYIETLRLNQQYEKGIEVYHNAIVRFPKDTSVLLNGGLLLLNAGQRAAGIDCLLLATDGFSDTNYEGWSQIIENLNIMLLHEEAEQFAVAALRRFPGESQIVFHAALTFHYLNKFNEALELYRKVIALNPDNQVAHSNIGAVYQAMGNMHEAKRAYQASFELLQTDAGLLVRETHHHVILCCVVLCGVRWS